MKILISVHCIAVPDEILDMSEQIRAAKRSDEGSPGGLNLPSFTLTKMKPLVCGPDKRKDQF